MLFSLLLRSYWHLMRLHGVNPEDFLAEAQGGELKGIPSDAEDRLVIRVDIVLTAVTLFLPLRVQVGWIIPFTALVVFLAAASLGALEGSNSISNGSHLFLLCFICLLGDRQQEQQVREKGKTQNIVASQKDLLRTQEQAMVTILSRFCDCLIQLRADLTIENEDGRLAATLLLSRDHCLPSLAQGQNQEL